MRLLSKNRKIYVLVNNKDIDYDFWVDLEDSDMEEAIKEYVRDCIDFFESVD